MLEYIKPYVIIYIRLYTHRGYMKMVAIYLDEKTIQKLRELRELGYCQSSLIRRWCIAGIASLERKAKKVE